MQQQLETKPEGDAIALARRLAEACLERKAQDVLAVDARGLTSFADTFVVASGGSDRQVRAITDSVLEAARALGENVIGKEGYEEGRWVLIDLADVIVHVFQADVREHYDLERLWEDAPRIDLDGVPGDKPAAAEAEQAR
ncbi:MAG: ribosome silencing factor [Myxococcota bacterium]|nr:ribosome silencing factor [Myxococcota bacterium]